MKKRLLSALLALALVFVLLPTTALAEVVSNYFDCDISILGNYWKFKKDSNNEYLPVYYKSEASSFEDGTVAPENNYLEIRKTGEKEITITVHGDVNITATGISIDTIAANKSVIINGDGHLTVKYTWTKSGQNHSAIAVSTLTVEGVALSAEASMGPALSATYGIHIKDGAMVEAKAGYFEAVCEGTTNEPGGITVDNATLVATATGGGNRSAIKTYGNIAFTNAKVTATNESSENAAIQAKTYKGTLNYLYVSGTSTITATNQSTSTDTMARAIGATIKNNNTSEKIEVGSSKVDAGKTWHTNAKQVTITSPALTKTSDVLIAGKDAVVGVETSIPSANGSGTYFYDQASKTLTLNNVNITKGINAIQFMADGTYTINLVGTNTISDVSAGIVASNLYGANDITAVLSGTGSLDITAGHYAINMQTVGNLKFENTGTIKLTTGYKYPASTCNALYVVGNVTIDKTKYDIKGEKQAQGFPTEDIGSSPDFKIILKGTSAEEDLYFKSITITPAAAKDSTISYDGTTLKQGETIKDGKGGTATVDSKNNTITLDNFKGNYPLEFNAEFTPNSITLIGDSTLSAVETKYQNLTISGSGSLTVGSIKVHNQKTSSDDKPNLTINGATVTVGTAELTTRAIDIDGDLTVTNGSLTATSASNNVPTVQVGGNASFTGSTVTITNNSTTQGEQYKDSNAASSALHVNGAVTISGGTVTAEAKAGGNAIRAVGNITVSNDAIVTATNNSQHFSAITAGQASGGVVNNLSKLIVSGETTKITATNSYANSSTGAIHAKIKNANEGHYLQVGTGTDTKAIAPNAEDNNTGRGSITITRGDAYETPQVTANYKIAGQTMHVGKYYKTDAKNGNITDGTAQDYNIYCDSENDFTLNNATISSTGTGGSTGVIMTNLNYSSAPFHIKLIGTNSINNAGHHAILGEGTYSTIIIENAENASNASLTISGNYLPVYSFGNVTINAEVVIVNTTDDNSFKGLISTNKDGHANGAFDLGSGYKCYASTSTTGTPLEEFNSANYSTYKYLRVTKETLETGGGSTCQHDWDEAWHDTGDGHHAHQCTKCQAFDTAHQQAHDRLPDESKGLDKGHTLKCGLCGYKYDQSIIESHVWSGWETFEQYFQLGDHAQRCNCGQLGHRHLKGELVYRPLDSEYHQQICSVEGCGYPGSTSKSEHVYEENSDICKYCGYDKSAPCDHTGDLVYTNNGDGTHKVTCKACGATLFEKQNHKFDPATGACVCGATQSGGDPTPDNPGTIVIIRPAEEEKPAQQPNPSTGANDLVGLAVAAAVAAALGSAALGSAALLRKHD